MLPDLLKGLKIMCDRPGGVQHTEELRAISCYRRISEDVDHSESVDLLLSFIVVSRQLI